MAERISPLLSTPPLAVPSVSAPPNVGPSDGFASTLARVIESVDTSAAQANAAVESMVTGEGDVHQAMIALQRAETALQVTVQVRNKLVQAYQDIMRMPV
jgi:flagellar hook-basal body complex protein FliE